MLHVLLSKVHVMLPAGLFGLRLVFSTVFLVAWESSVNSLLSGTVVWLNVENVHNVDKDKTTLSVSVCCVFEEVTMYSCTLHDSIGSELRFYGTTHFGSCILASTNLFSAYLAH